MKGSEIRRKTKGQAMSNGKDGGKELYIKICLRKKKKREPNEKTIRDEDNNKIQKKENAKEIVLFLLTLIKKNRTEDLFFFSVSVLIFSLSFFISFDFVIV